MTFHDDVTRATKLVSTMQCEPGRADVTTGIQSHPAVLSLRKDNAHATTGSPDVRSDVELAGVGAAGAQDAFELKRFRPEVWFESEGSGGTTSDPRSDSSTKVGSLV